MPATEPSTPPSLLERVRRSDDRAGWERFVSLYTPLLLTWAKRFNVTDADQPDIAQDVFRVLLRKLPTFRYNPAESFRGYLLTLVRSKAMDHHRRRVAAGFPAPLDPDATVSPDAVADWVDADYDAHIVRHALRLIATDFDATTNEAFRRYALDGEPAEQVAAALGLSVPALYQIKTRVLRRLREELAGLMD